jgi:hypothetical protein
MFTNKGIRILFITAFLTISSAVIAQDRGKSAVLAAQPVLWQQVDIASRDLYWGPGGREMFPDTKSIKLIDRKPGGNNVKFEVEDASGRRWVVKASDESRPEIAANRLLWALGYNTEIDYFVPRFTAQGFSTFSNVRFELRPKGVKRGDSWSWMDNPFRGTRELAGLKVFMALINNWDIKDENTSTIIRDSKVHYIVSDLGASFGKLADQPLSRSGRSVGNADDYAKASFIKGVDNGMLVLDYRGMNQDVIKGIRIEDARWIADLLMQLTDAQISDAFRAAGYKKDDLALYAAAFKSRVAALDNATQGAVVAAQ